VLNNAHTTSIQQGQHPAAGMPHSTLAKPARPPAHPDARQTSGRHARAQAVTAGLGAHTKRRSRFARLSRSPPKKRQRRSNKRHRRSTKPRRGSSSGNAAQEPRPTGGASTVEPGAAGAVTGAGQPTNGMARGTKRRCYQSRKRQ